LLPTELTDKDKYHIGNVTAFKHILYKYGNARKKVGDYFMTLKGKMTGKTVNSVYQLHILN